MSRLVRPFRHTLQSKVGPLGKNHPQPVTLIKVSLSMKQRCKSIVPLLWPAVPAKKVCSFCIS